MVLISTPERSMRQSRHVRYPTQKRTRYHGGGHEAARHSVQHRNAHATRSSRRQSSRSGRLSGCRKARREIFGSPASTSRDDVDNHATRGLVLLSRRHNHPSRKNPATGGFGFDYTEPANALNDENILLIGDLEEPRKESIARRKTLGRFPLNEIDRMIRKFGNEPG